MSPSTPQAPLTTSFLSPQPHSHVASRESRISLPDEARRYYENYSDSPLSSPHANATGGEGWTQNQPHAQLQGANGNRALSQVPEEGVSRSNDNSPRPFLDLETTDFSGSECHPSSATSQEAESALDSLPSEEEALGLKSFVNKEGTAKRRSPRRQ